MTDKQRVQNKIRNILEHNVIQFSELRRKSDRRPLGYKEEDDLQQLDMFLDAPWIDERIQAGVKGLLKSLYKDWWRERQVWGDWQ